MSLHVTVGFFPLGCGATTPFVPSAGALKFYIQNVGSLTRLEHVGMVVAVVGAF